MKRKGFGLFGILSFCLGLFIFSGSLTSCDDSVGLGEMVDTSAPTISISYPPAGAAIRDWFMISGTCKDDLSVALVTVTLTNLDTGVSYDLGSTTPMFSDSWSVTVNTPSYNADGSVNQFTGYNGYPIPDGQNYEVTAVVYDYAGHSTYDKRSFIIDNTAPVVVLSNPTSYGTGTSPKSYGRALKVTGDFSEANKLAKMDINVYDKPASNANMSDNSDINLLASMSFSNIDELSEYIVARYYATEPTDPSSEDYRLYQNYKNIYGTSELDQFNLDGSAVTKPFYMTFKFTDGTKVYQQPGDGGKPYGNEATQYFIKDTVFETNFTSSNATTPLTVSGIRTILNGTHAVYNRNSSIYTTLASCYSADFKKAAADYAEFNGRGSSVKLNPKNNPTFLVANNAWADTQSQSGSSFTEGFFKYINGTPVTVTFSAGVDQDSLLLSDKTKPVTVWAVPMDVDTSASIADKTTALLATKDISGNVIADKLAAIDIANPATYPANWIKVWSSYDMNPAPSNDVSYTPEAVSISAMGGWVYKYFVVGEDTIGNSIEEANGSYSFYSYSTTGKPSIEIGIEDVSTNKNLSDGTVIPSNFLKGKDIDGNALTNKFKFTGTATPADSTVYISKIDVTYKITDRATGASKTFSTLPASASLTYAGNAAGDARKGVVASWTAEITDNINVSGNFKYEVTFKVYDSLGSTETVKRAFYVDNAAPTLTVSNMASNREVIFGSDYMSYISEDNSGASTKYYYSFRGEWSDVNGIGTEKLQYSTCDDTSAASPVWSAWTTLTDSTVPNVTTKAGWSTDVEVVPGLNKGIKFRAVDGGGNIYEPAALEFTNISYDFDEPVVTINPMPSYTNTGNIVLKGTASDALLDKIDFVIKKDDVDVTGTYVTPADFHDISTTSKSFEINIPVKNDHSTDGNWTFTVTATDKTGTETTVTPVGPFIIDTTAPLWAETWNSGASAQKIDGIVYNASNWYKSQSLSFEGAYIENNSGIDAVYYWIRTPDQNFAAPIYVPASKKFFADDGLGNPSSTEVAPSGTFATTDGGSVETFKATLGSFDSGTDANHVYFVAVDKAGNISPFTSRDILVDQASPLLESSVSGTLFSNKVFDISVNGTYSDDASGVASIVLTINGKNVTVPSANIDTALCTWTASIPASTILSSLSDQTYPVTAKITDRAGNSSQSTIFKIAIDTVAPAYTISSKLSRTGVNGKKEISGTVIEANEPVSFKLYYTRTNPASLTPSAALTGWNIIDYASPAGAGPNVTEITNPSKIYNWSYGINENDEDFRFDFTANSQANKAANGKDTIYILPVIVDSAGNCNIYTSAVGGTKTYSYAGKYETFTVDLATDRPVFKFSDISVASGSRLVIKNSEGGVITGTVTDDDDDGTNVVQKIVLSETPCTAVDAQGRLTFADATGTTTATTVDGGWTFTPATTSDGTIDLYLYAVDNEDSEFGTALANAEDAPSNYAERYYPFYQIKSDASTRTAADDKITYISDTESPEVESIKYAFCDTKNGTYAAETEDWEDLSASIVLGGVKKRYVKLQITASDDNGIDSITTTVAGSTVVMTKDVSASTTKKSVYVSEAIDCQTLTLARAVVKEGSVDVKVVVIDKCGMKGNGNSSFYCDNQVDLSSFSVSTLGTEVYTSSVTINGSMSDGAGAGIDTISWIIPPKNKTADVIANYKNYTWNTHTSENTTKVSWGFVFDGTETNNPLLTSYTDSTHVSQYDVTVAPGNTAVKIVPILFKLTDKLGNVGIYSSYTIRYNPYANWPSAKIIYPSVGATVGSTVRVTGSATDNNAVQKVYIQISTAAANTDQNIIWNRNDACVQAGITAGSSENYNKIVDLATAWPQKNSGGEWIDDARYQTSYAANECWGIEASNTVSWNININQFNEYNPSGSTARTIYMRACAVDNEGLVGLWSDPVKVLVDSSVPQIGFEKLLRYNAGDVPAAGSVVPANVPTASIENYEADRYLTKKNGLWYIQATAADDQGIDTVTVYQTIGGGNPSNITANCAIVESENIVSKVPGATGKDRRLWIPISMNTEGSVSIQISAKEKVGADSSAKTGSYTFSFNVDNVGPVIGELKSSTVTETNIETIEFNKLQNSNGFAEIGSTVSDAASGFYKLAYYFKKNGKIYNAFPKDDSGVWCYPDSVDNGISAGTLTEDSDLYGKTVAGTVNSTTLKFTPTTKANITGNSNIRVGGLAKVNGIFYTISDIDSNGVVTIDAESLTSGSENVFFPYAIAVDSEIVSESPSGNTSGYTITETDGDGIIETVSKNGARYTWSTSIMSDIIDDGKIDIVVVAFDNAGNTSTTTTSTMISNHAPRLSQVWLATDLNGDSYFSENEFARTSVNGSDEITTYAYSAVNSITGKAQEAPVLSTDYTYLEDRTTKHGTFSVKDGLAITFEYLNNTADGNTEGNIGGGTKVSYIPELSTVGAATAPKTGVTVTGAISDVSSKLKLGSNDNGIASTGIVFTSAQIKAWSSYSPAMENSTSDYENDTTHKSYLQLSLWDNVNIASDNAAASTYIATRDTMNGRKIAEYGNQWTVLNVPFLLDIEDDIAPSIEIASLTKDSAYKDSDGNVLGHVEEGKYLPSSIFKNTNSTYLDRDDKISGQIELTGSVSDNFRIKSLTLAAAGAAETLFTEKTVASFAGGTLVPNASYGKTSFNTNHFYFEIIEEEFSQSSGHKVDWRLVVDSSFVLKSGTRVYAAPDIIFTVRASDTNAVALTDTKTKRVDIVPYISGLFRSASANSEIDFTYRSAYGEYPIAVGDTITVKGFNFGTSPEVKCGTKSVPNLSNKTAVSFDAAGIEYSGELTVSVNGMLSLNHLNNNAIENNQEDAADFESNEESTSSGTVYDNRFIRVWDVGHYFKNSAGGNMPTMATDNTGNLFSTWALMGTGSIQLQKGLDNVNKPVYIGYDQPDKESAIGIDVKSNNGEVTNGNLSVLFFPANVGSSGTPDSTAYSAADTMGGVWGVNLYNDFTAAGNYTLASSNKHLVLKGNPYVYLDSKINSSGYQLASASMRREVSQFKNGHTVRYGDYMHYVYYDSYNKALRYTMQTAGKKISVKNPLTEDGGYTATDRTSYANTKDIVGWILIDGKSDEQDRIHHWNDNDLELIWSNNGGGVTSLTNAGGALGANGKSIYINFNCAGAKSLAIPYTDEAGVYKVDLHTVSSLSADGKTLYWTDHEFPKNSSGAYYAPTGLAVYKGESNVVPTGSGVAQINNKVEGSYSSIDVTKTGKPVIVYYDAGGKTLRIAYSSVNNPDMYNYANGRNKFTRQSLSGIVSGGTYVQAKIDGNNYLHIIYRNNQGHLCYIKSRNAPDGAAYTFNSDDVMEIDTLGTYGTLSLIRSGAAGSYVYTPCVSFLNSEGTENGVKFSMLRTVDEGYEIDNGVLAATATETKAWDTYVVPAVKGNFVTGGEYIYTEGFNGWTKQDTVKTSECDAIIGYNTGRMDVLFLKNVAK